MQNSQEKGERKYPRQPSISETNGQTLLEEILILNYTPLVSFSQSFMKYKLYKKVTRGLHI